MSSPDLDPTTEPGGPGPVASDAPRGRLGRRGFLGAAAAATGAVALVPLQSGPAAADPGRGQGQANGLAEFGGPTSSAGLPPSVVSLVPASTLTLEYCEVGDGKGTFTRV